MKKVLVSLICISFTASLSFAASGKVSIQEQNVVAETGVMPAKENNKESEKTASKTESKSVSVKINKNSKDSGYQIPKELAEPDIITIESTSGKEDQIKEELVIIDLPPLIDDEDKSLPDAANDKKADTTDIDKTEEENQEQHDSNELDKDYNLEEEKDISSSQNTQDTPVQETGNIEEYANKKETLPAETKVEEKIEENPDSGKVSEETGNNNIGNTSGTAEEQPEETVVEEETVLEEEIEAEIESNVIKTSRSVTLKRKEYVDITYPGTGWIYSGIIDGSRDLLYFGRALGTKDTTFTLQARYPGTKVLHFYKNDYLTGEYIDDYIEIIVLPEENNNKTHISAPAYQQPMPEIFEGKEIQLPVLEDEEYVEDEVIALDSQQPVKTENVKPSGNVKPAQQTTKNIKSSKSLEKKDTHSSENKGLIPAEQETKSAEPETNEKIINKTEGKDPETLLKEAGLLYNENEFEPAFLRISTFLENATKNIDQGLLLKGKILEADSDIQDIKEAIEAYTALIKEYPASKYWDYANKRIIYLKRFYLEVR